MTMNNTDLIPIEQKIKTNPIPLNLIEMSVVPAAVYNEVEAMLFFASDNQKTVSGEAAVKEFPSGIGMIA
ncbi:MAG: hypothetical protein WC127_01485 [Acidaminococcaceae bacterium]